jgi:S-methylmethionine-dependent homocysteine/selenocysteine methylase
MTHNPAHNRAFFSALNCPTTVTWTANIAKMFTGTDIAHMKQVTNNQLDLGNYASAKIWAHAIYSRVASGSMPPPGSGEGPWTPDMVNTFGCWIQKGCPQ